MNFGNILITIMLNKRKKYMDPTRINNYNKLLTTIDKNTTFPISNSESEKKDEPTINTLLDKLKLDKIDLDKIIDNISNNYILSNYNSSSFTGQTKKDIFKKKR